MARRNQSTIEDLIDLAAMLPWWAGVLLACVAYFVIHPFAVEPVPTATAMSDMGQAAAKQMVRTFALFGQYILPAAFLIGAILSFIKRVKKQRLLTNTASVTSQNAVKSLSWQEFELLVGEAFRQKGYIVQNPWSVLWFSERAAWMIRRPCVFHSHSNPFIPAPITPGDGFQASARAGSTNWSWVVIEFHMDSRNLSAWLAC